MRTKGNLPELRNERKNESIRAVNFLYCSSILFFPSGVSCRRKKKFGRQTLYALNQYCSSILLFSLASRVAVKEFGRQTLHALPQYCSSILLSWPCHSSKCTVVGIFEQKIPHKKMPATVIKKLSRPEC